MAMTTMMMTASAMEDDTSDAGVAPVSASAAENDSQLMSADDTASALLSMGPILPANPEDTTCYW